MFDGLAHGVLNRQIRRIEQDRILGGFHRCGLTFGIARIPGANILKHRLQLGVEPTGAQLVMAAARTHRSASAQFDRLSNLAAAERRRIRDRTKSTVSLPQDARLMTQFVAPGQSVSPGATLAHAVDCRAQRVVAIFPQRHADVLEPGRKVSLHADAWRRPRGGYVDRVLPRTNTSFSELYAVPFPPIERRELYAVVAFADVGQAAADCDVGRWVEVRVGAGLVPKALRKMNTVMRRTGQSLVAEAAEPRTVETAALRTGRAAGTDN